MDADVIYQPDSLRKMTRHLSDPQVGAVTAYIREGGVDPRYLTRFIGYEYVAAQAATRRAQNVLGVLACLAGGAQLHSRENLEAIGGRIDTTTLAEDTVSTILTQLNGRRVVFEPYAVVLAEEPESIGALWKQRLRWGRGNVQVTRRFSGLWFRPSKHRGLGGFSFGIIWFSVFLLPVAMVLSSVGLIGLYFLDSDLAMTIFGELWFLALCTYIFITAMTVQLDPATGRRSWREAIAFPGIISLLVMLTAFAPDLFTRTVPGLCWIGDDICRRRCHHLVPLRLVVAVYAGGVAGEEGGEDQAGQGARAGADLSRRIRAAAVRHHLRLVHQRIQGGRPGVGQD